MERAAEISASNGHDFIGTEHVLLALIDDSDGVAGLVIHHLGMAKALRQEVQRIIDSVGYRSKG